MRRIYLFLLLLMCGSLKAQTFTPPSFADVDNNYRNYVNQVFGALEANRIPTGLLADYGFDFTDPKIYNGSVLVDSNDYGYLGITIIGDASKKVTDGRFDVRFTR